MFGNLGAVDRQTHKIDRHLKRILSNLSLIKMRLRRLRSAPQAESTKIDGAPAWKQIEVLQAFVDMHLIPALQKGEVKRVEDAVEKMAQRIGGIESGWGIKPPKKQTKPGPGRNATEGDFERPFITSPEEPVDHDDLMPDWAKSPFTQTPEKAAPAPEKRRKFNWLPIAAVGGSVALVLLLKRVI